jgi:hypothetical protein
MGLYDCLADDGTEFHYEETKRRKRSTKAEVAQLEKQIHDVLEEDHPQSVRHVFYRMTDPRLPVFVEKSEDGYIKVQHRILQMRRENKLPYYWIADHTRRGFHVYTWDNIGDFFQSQASMYRGDLWINADYYCEVWCESRSIAGVVEDDCDKLAVSLYPTGGFSSATLAYEAARDIKRKYEKRQRKIIIFYIGDYDPAGVLIDVALEKELRRHLAEVKGLNLDFRRLALTPAQIKQYDLPSKPRKITDKRKLEIIETVEAEAMPAHILREMLKAEIEQFLPQRAIEVVEEIEKEERNLIWGIGSFVSNSENRKKMEELLRAVD